MVHNQTVELHNKNDRSGTGTSRNTGLGQITAASSESHSNNCVVPGVPPKDDPKGASATTLNQTFTSQEHQKREAF
eukprot:6191862-Pleurochrysis_carterae.AAC.2